MENTGEYNSSNIHPLALLVLLILGICILVLKRDYTLIPIVVAVCFIPFAQRLVIAGFDFTILRFLVLFAWIRMILRNEFSGYKWHYLDILLVLYIIIDGLIFFIAVPVTNALVYKLGKAFDYIGLYFLFRIALKTKDDIKKAIWIFIILSIPVMIFFSVEKVTGVNMFSIFGGVPQFTLMREGTLRVQGAFSHPILAGTFWALVLPLVIPCIQDKTGIQRTIGYIGLFSIILCIFLTASSTPLMVAFCTVVGMAMFYFRYKMKKVRLAILAGYIGLDLIMVAPVYSLIARIDLTGGSTGWHRYNLIHQAILHFPQWAVLGMGTVSTETWGWGLWDVTCEYVAIGISGGALTLIVYLLILIFAFREVGIAINNSIDNSPDQKFCWHFGIMLLSHTIAFLVISYFGQLMILFIFSIAAIAGFNNYRTKEQSNQ
ncbi:MAG: hypothetical protein JXR70_02320 [Spirochaetales bacterium]|nr:hypothetical protein [Spirochaetales bacterium]